MTIQNLLSQIGMGPKHLAESHHGGGHKSNAAMSALTLLSFLFFLHILQQCLRDHMMAMSTAPVVIVQSRDGEEPIAKTGKVDKTGINDDDAEYEKDLMKINTAEHTPSLDAERYRKMFQSYGNRSAGFRGFVSAMDDDLK
ncbi:hypothetical protein O0L34_g13982 [Tuta absoluta]|nr:hypothetical protein O0L34_g13982 [Tuta absoluta]